MLKDIVSKYKRLKNIVVVKTGINEVLAVAQQHQKIKDMHLHSVQGAVTAAAIPLLLAANVCQDKNTPLSRKVHIKYCMNSFTLLVQVNSVINKTRRQNLKSGLKPTFQSACDKVPDKNSKCLFGDDMHPKQKR